MFWDVNITLRSVALDNLLHNEFKLDFVKIDDLPMSGNLTTYTFYPSSSFTRAFSL